MKRMIMRSYVFTVLLAFCVSGYGGADFLLTCEYMCARACNATLCLCLFLHHSLPTWLFSPVMDMTDRPVLCGHCPFQLFRPIIELDPWKKNPLISSNNSITVPPHKAITFNLLWSHNHCPWLKYDIHTQRIRYTCEGWAQPLVSFPSFPSLIPVTLYWKGSPPIG